MSSQSNLNIYLKFYYLNRYYSLFDSIPKNNFYFFDPGTEMICKFCEVKCCSEETLAAHLASRGHKWENNFTKTLLYLIFITIFENKFIKLLFNHSKTCQGYGSSGSVGDVFQFETSAREVLMKV